MCHIVIQSISLVNNQITVLFDQVWYQEDIIRLRQLLFDNIPNLSIKEVILGADIESIRFQWKNTEFIVKFDYYSQSCWFDTQYSNSGPDTQDLFKLLTHNKKHYV
jgi:hypothetical protein